MVEINEAHRSLAGDETVVSVGRLAELRGVVGRHRGRHDAPRVPASPTPRSPVRRSSDLLPALGQAARTVGSPQIRNAATIGGNLATCSPAGDGLPVLAALDATVELLGPDGVRTMTGRRVHDRRQAHGPASGRAADGRHAPVARRLAGLRQGRRPQRHGDRHRRRLPGHRRSQPHACASPSARWRRRSCGRRRPRRSPTATVDWDARRDRRRRRRPLRRRWPPTPPARSTTTGPARPTAVEPSRCSPGACCDGRSRSVSEQYTLHVNGTAHPVADAWLGESLLYVLRERLGLYGAKGACEQGECGSCSVLVDGELVCSCLVLAASAIGAADHDDRGPRRAGGADRRAAGVRRRRRRAVRLLHAGPGDGRPRPARPQRRADADRDPRGAVRQHLPLHRATAASSPPCSRWPSSATGPGHDAPTSSAAAAPAPVASVTRRPAPTG